VGKPGPRFKSGGDGPIAVTVEDRSANGAPALVVFNGGSGTATELPGVGQGFFDDRQPATLFRFGSALEQPPTFVGTTGLGYVVTAEGNLLRFNLSSPGAGASLVYSGQQVVAAQTLANGQVVAALASGAVDLLEPQGGGLAVASVLQAQGGVPAQPSAIDVVSKPGGQFNVLVSSEGSDNIFVFAQAALAGEPGGTLGGSSPSATFNSVQTPALSSASLASVLTASVIATSSSATTTSSSTSASTSSSAVSVTISATVGLSLGTFSSLGNSSTRENSGTLLVPVEGNTYLSVPILDFWSGNNEEGEREERMPALSAKYNFGDTSPLTRFIIGLDEALRSYRGSDEEPLSRGVASVRDPWSEDLFRLHLPVEPPATGRQPDGPQAARPVHRIQTRPARAHSPGGKLDGAGVRSAEAPPDTSGLILSSAGLLAAGQLGAAKLALASRELWTRTPPDVAQARRRRLSPVD
jgi:hypothetical protein